MRRNDRPTSAVAPTNGRHHSPAANNNQESASPSLAGAAGASEAEAAGASEALRSSASSPMFGTEPLPEDDHSHCPYCHKNYRKPRVLDCLHSMCEDCIIAQLDGRLQQKSAAAEERARRNTLDCELEAPKVTERPTPPGVIRCPTCAQESHVGNDVRYVHAMLLDFVRVAEMEESNNSTADRRCRACKSDQEAVAVCKQCQSDLCANCVSAHGLMKLFDGHVVTSYEEMEGRGTQPEARPVLCTSHGHATRFLCANCESMACKQCLESDHVNHKVIEVNELVTSTIMEDVGNHVDKMERKWELTMEELSNLPDRSAQLHEQYETARGILEAYYDDVMKAVEDSKQKKLAELDEARQRQEHNIDDLYRKMQVNEARIHDAITFTRRLISKANGAEMVASRRKVVQQLGNLTHAIPSHGHQVELEYQPLVKKQMEQLVSNLAGNVVGRMIQPTVKDVVAPIGSEMVTNRVFQQQPQVQIAQSSQNNQQVIGQQAQTISIQDDWGRAMYSGSVAPSANLGAIGGERKNKAAAAAAAAANGGIGMTNGHRGGVPASGEAFGWPPSSNPPELSNSPPPVTPVSQLQQQQQQQQVQQIVQLQQQQQQLQAQAAATVPTTLPLLGSNPVVGNGSQTSIQGLAGLGAAAGLRPDLAEIMALANAGQLSLSQTPNVGGNVNSSMFPNVLWSQPTLNGISSNAAAAAAAAAAGGGLNSANSALLQQKLAQANLQMLMNSQNRNMISNNLLAMASLRNTSIDQILASFGTLGLNGNASAAAAQLNLAAAAAADLPPPQAIPGAQIGPRGHDMKVHSVFGTSQQGSSIRELHCPSGFCLSETDDILIADTNNHRVVVCGPPHPWKIGRPGTDDGQLCFPRKVIALKGESARYVVLDKGGDGKTRAQIFEGRGEFVKRINMLALVPRGGIEVSAAAATPNGQLLLVDTAGVVYSIDVDTPRVTFWFDASAHLGEASDVAMYDSNIYITDFKHHCVQVFNSEGKFIRKMGEPSQTPYPIGIDITRSGEVLVADTHGNHLHVVVFNAEGQHQHSFTHNEFRLSRCVGLRIAKSGHVVTLCKHNHTLFVFKPLVLPNGVPVPATSGAITSSLINKFP